MGQTRTRWYSIVNCTTEWRTTKSSFDAGSARTPSIDTTSTSNSDSINQYHSTTQQTEFASCSDCRHVRRRQIVECRHQWRSARRQQRTSSRISERSVSTRIPQPVCWRWLSSRTFGLYGRRARRRKSDWIKPPPTNRRFMDTGRSTHSGRNRQRWLGPPGSATAACGPGRPRSRNGTASNPGRVAAFHVQR